MVYEAAMKQYEAYMRAKNTYMEDRSMELAVATAQAMEMEGVRRLELSIKAPPGSSYKEEYQEICQKLAEWTGQTKEQADAQIKRAAERIGRVPGWTDERPRDEEGNLLNVCKTCILESQGRCRRVCFFAKMTKEVSDRRHL